MLILIVNVLIEILIYILKLHSMEKERELTSTTLIYLRCNETNKILFLKNRCIDQGFLNTYPNQPSVIRLMEKSFFNELKPYQPWALIIFKLYRVIKQIQMTHSIYRLISDFWSCWSSGVLIEIHLEWSGLLSGRSLGALHAANRLWTDGRTFFKPSIISAAKRDFPCNLFPSALKVEQLHKVDLARDRIVSKGLNCLDTYKA